MVCMVEWQPVPLSSGRNGEIVKCQRVECWPVQSGRYGEICQSWMLTCSKWQKVSLRSWMNSASILLPRSQSLYGNEILVRSQWKHWLMSQPPNSIVNCVDFCDNPSSTQQTDVFWSPTSTTQAYPTPDPNVAHTDSCGINRFWTFNILVIQTTCLNCSLELTTEPKQFQTNKQHNTPFYSHSTYKWTLYHTT